MDYLQKAIERARKTRHEGGEDGAQPVSGEQVPAQTQGPPESALHGANVAGKDTISITYTGSRQVDLNPRLLMDNRVVAAFDNDPRGEPYRHLRTQILKEFQKNQWRTLAITSAHQGAGKTLTSINTAIALAKEVNQTVLLVDLDFKGPSIVEVLGLQVDAGLVEYLNGDASLQDVMINPGLDRLVILPALQVSGPTSEILSSPRMMATLKELVGRYEERLIIFDLPPLLRDDDALVFTPYVDATLLVVEQGVTTPDEVERCLQLLQGTNVIGTVFNKTA